jgi:hypothetical protein
MRKLSVAFLLFAAVALPSFARTGPGYRRLPITAAPDISQLGPDAQLERRVVDAVYQKFGRDAAASIWVHADRGEVIVNGGFSEMMMLQVLSRVRKVEGVKTARWGLI